MTLKERLDEQWNSGGCVYPNYLVRWKLNIVGELVYTKGKLCQLRLKNRKVGYSFKAKFTLAVKRRFTK